MYKSKCYYYTFLGIPMLLEKIQIFSASTIYLFFFLYDSESCMRAFLVRAKAYR